MKIAKKKKERQEKRSNEGEKLSKKQFKEFSISRVNLMIERAH